MNFQIKANDENKFLSLNLINEEYLTVAIKKEDFSLVHTVFLYTDLNSLKKFFKSVSEASQTSSNPQTWSSVEEDLILHATYQSEESVNLKIKIVHNLGEHDWWEHQTSFYVERSVLQKLSQ